MNPEVRTARKPYMWLWFSPLLTIPSALLLALAIWLFSDFSLVELASGLIPILGSALWHLVLLIWALNKQSAFVRWHGWQALLLAGIRTAVPITFLIFESAEGGSGSFVLMSIGILIVIWLYGTLWGQGQAACGDCALMRWTGHGAGLPLPTAAGEPAVAARLGPPIDERTDHRAAYYQGLRLREQGQLAEAVQVFHGLLVSDAAPELKARVAEELMHIGETVENLGADVLVAVVRFGREPARRRMALAELERLGLVEPM